jgi:hypothetical protein
MRLQIRRRLLSGIIGHREHKKTGLLLGASNRKEGLVLKVAGKVHLRERRVCYCMEEIYQQLWTYRLLFTAGDGFFAAPDESVGTGGQPYPNHPCRHGSVPVFHRQIAYADSVDHNRIRARF